MNTKQAAAAAKSGYSTKELVLDAMFIALTYVFTAFVNAVYCLFPHVPYSILCSPIWYKLLSSMCYLINMKRIHVCKDMRDNRKIPEKTLSSGIKSTFFLFLCQST